MTDTTDRCCTNCGKSVENHPYQFWLFHTCNSCAWDASPARFRDGSIGTGTYRKWRYFPSWHMTEHPEASNPRQTEEITTDGGTDRIQFAMSDLIVLYRQGEVEIGNVRIELLDGAREILDVAEEHGDRL